MAKFEVELDENYYNILVKMADTLGVSIAKMCKHVLEEFTHQGKVYGGIWPEGPGKRLIIDFPKYSSRVLKIPESELK